MDENQSPAPNQPTESNPAPNPENTVPPTAPISQASSGEKPQSDQPTQPTPTPTASTPPPPQASHVPPPPPIYTQPHYNPPPPGFTPPPLVAAGQSPAPSRNGRGWMILSLILLVVLAVVLFGSFAVKKSVRGYARQSSGTSVRHRHEYLEEVTIEDNSASDKVLVIEINGVISSAGSDRSEKNMVESIAEQLEVAKDDRNIRAVILKVNSPGGEVLASDEIYNSIKNFQDITHRPVIASMQTLAASGGYYVSAPCRWIVANDLTITGSIGVIMHGFNYRGLMNKVGLRPMIFKSGKFKDMLSGDKDLDTDDPKERAEIEEEKEMVQELIMETYGKFTNIVHTGRSDAYAKNSKNRVEEDKGRPLADNWTDYIDGRVLSGKKAYELGFVDELGNFDVAKDRALTLTGVHSANFVEYQRPFDLGNIFRLLGSTESKTATLKVDLGVNALNLQAGQLYFIAPTSIPK